MAGSKSSRGIRANVKTFKLKSNVSGMVQNRASTFLTMDKAVDILNMHATEEGTWSADKAGYTKINADGAAYESGADIDGMQVFRDSSGVKHLFFASNSKLLEIDTDTGAATEIDASAGYTAGSPVDFLAINDALYTVDGTIAKPRKWDGASATDSPGWPISDGVNSYDTPKYCETHQQRAVFLNFDGRKGHFAVSTLNDPEDFTVDGTGAGGFIDEAGVGDGQAIVGARSMHIPASNSSQLVIFKEESTYVMTGNSALFGDPDYFKVIDVNDGYGALNNRVIIQVGNDLLSLDVFGITSYSTTNQSGTLQPTAIESDRVKGVISRLNLSAADKCWGIHLPNRREVWWFLPTGSNTQCNEAIIYKYPSPGSQDELPKWSRRKDAGGQFKMAHGCMLDRTFYVGSYTGIVGTMFTSSTYDGTGIPWIYEYPPWDGGNEKQNKGYINGDALFKVRSNQMFTLTYKWQGGGCNDGDSVSYPIETTVTDALYGTAAYGTDYYGEQEEVLVPYEIFGDGLKITHKLSGVTNDTGPEFLGLLPILEMGSISQHWH